jgi:DNA-binding CsgD family transcriptional regulator
VAKKFDGQYKWQKLGFKTRKEYKKYANSMRAEAKKITEKDRISLSEKTGLPLSEINVHHIISLSDGGSNLPENLVVCTRDEHYKKYHPDMWDFDKNCSIFGLPDFKKFGGKLDKHPRWLDLNDFKEDIISLRYDLNSIESIIKKLELNCSEGVIEKRLKLWLGDKEYTKLTKKVKKQAEKNQGGKNNGNYKKIDSSELLELHIEGLTLPEIGEHFNIAPDTAKNKLIDIIGNDFKPNKPDKSKIDIDVDKCYFDYVSKKFNWEELADQYNTTGPTIKIKVEKKYGKIKPMRKRKGKNSPSYKPYNRDDFLFYYMQGYDLKDIGDKLNIGEKKINNILKEIYGSNYNINDRPIMWSDRIIIDKREPKFRLKSLTEKFKEFELPYYYATLPTFDVANKYVGVEIKKGDDFIGSILGTSRLRSQLARIIEAPQPVKMILIIDPKYKSHYSKISASSIAGM